MFTDSTRCKISKIYVDECFSFTCPNGKNWEIRSKITCSTVDALYYLECDMCKLETYIGKLIGGFKIRMNKVFQIVSFLDTSTNVVSKMEN